MVLDYYPLYATVEYYSVARVPIDPGDVGDVTSPSLPVFLIYIYHIQSRFPDRGLQMRDGKPTSVYKT